MRNLVVASVAVALLAGCASAGAGKTTSWAQNDCLDGRKDVRSFEVVDSRTVRVKQSSFHQYEVRLEEDCPELEDAIGIGFANGPQKYVGRIQGRPVFANTMGLGRICGRGFDQVVISRVGSNITDGPMRTCKIQSVHRIGGEGSVYTNIQ